MMQKIINPLTKEFFSQFWKRKTKPLRFLQWEINTKGIREFRAKLIKDFRREVELYKLRISDLNTAILVYSMGKAGTSTVYESLKQLEIPIYHIHNLSHDGIKLSEERSRNFRDKKIPYITRVGKIIIDIYAYPYNHNNGFTIIRSGSVEVLVIRSEDLNRSFSNAISKFFNLTAPLKIKHANIRSTKKFSAAYDQVKTNAVFPQATCRKV